MWDNEEVPILLVVQNKVIGNIVKKWTDKVVAEADTIIDAAQMVRLSKQKGCFTNHPWRVEE